MQRPAARPSILKTLPGFVPQTTYQSQAQLFEAATAAYSSLASTLVRENAPEAFTTDAFTGSLKEIVTAYRIMMLCRHNSHMVQNLAWYPLPTHATDSDKEKKTDPETDPEFWANVLLLQWFHVHAKLQSKNEPARSVKIQAALNKRSREEEEEDIAPRSKRLYFHSNHSERAFAKDGALEEEVIHVPTRSFDGIAPGFDVLDTLLVNWSDKRHPCAHTVYTTDSRVNAFLRTNPSTTVIESVISALRATSEQIRTAGFARIFPSHVRLNGIHTQSLNQMESMLLVKLALPAAESN
jgi:hypothetical protein